MSSTTDPVPPPVGGLSTSDVAGKIKVTFTGVTETLLIPLLGRAVDAATQSPILGDPYAKGVMQKLNYDFEKLPMPPTHAAAVALRTRFYDRWARAFLAANPRATVLHLACGLDSRNQRVDWGPGVRWIDIDLPEVVELRGQVLPTTLPGRDYRLVAADVTHDAWLEQVPTDCPVLVIMEGLVSYLSPEDATNLLGRLAGRLGEGELHFDSMNSTVLKASRKDTKAAVNQTGSVYKWAVDDLKDIEKIHHSLRLLEAVRYIEAAGVEEFPLLTRVGYYMMSWVPSLRDSVRFVRFGFSEDAR
ncbi:putative polyketide synthase [Rosellinia necatrix]|uniref:Putative polyketide synthase n=1 Tax=Rosellinia necatrix TaxID=77044 RepID=A0A1S7UQQ4_ROSNE|nr:putative polyketide synthase [Rosellinia necatrix]